MALITSGWQSIRRFNANLLVDRDGAGRTMTASPALSVVHGLRGHRVGTGWMALCPAHKDSTPSLSITVSRDGKPLVHCHAGCSQAAVIAALRERGLWNGGPANDVRIHRCFASNAAKLIDADKTHRISQALRIWSGSRHASGTVVSAYLRQRGISLPPPATIRFHPGLMHHRSLTVRPAMIALVTLGATNTPVGIHRTWLAREGRGKAPVKPNKMMLGPCRGGVVRLGAAEDRLMVAEGIETALSAMQATGQPAWAALSTSGLRALDLPPDVRDVVILADGDDPGEAAAHHAGLRWVAEGRRVRIARPPRGLDFNDLLMRGAPNLEEGVW